jgi:ornithine carbamoyltransferase
LEPPEMNDGLEATNEVSRPSASIVFGQTENRPHTIKAVLMETIG